MKQITELSCNEIASVVGGGVGKKIVIGTSIGLGAGIGYEFGYVVGCMFGLMNPLTLLLGSLASIAPHNSEYSPFVAMMKVSGTVVGVVGAVLGGAVGAALGGTVTKCYTCCTKN